MGRRVQRAGIGPTKALIENFKREVPMSFAELAEITGTPIANLYRVATRLRRQGRIPESTRQGAKGGLRAEEMPGELPKDPPVLSKPPNLWDANDLAAIDALPVLTPQQRLKLLSAIGMRPSQGTSQVTALGKLDDIDRGVGSQVGPGEPLTEEGRVERLGRLMKAVGRETVNKAMEAAFGQGSTQEIAYASTSEPSANGPSDVG